MKKFLSHEFYPENRMNRYYGNNIYNDVFKDTLIFKPSYGGLPNNIKPYKNCRTFKRNYKKCVFDTRYQNDHIEPIPIQTNFELVAAFADVIFHALALTKKIISMNTDDHKIVDTVSQGNVAKIPLYQSFNY